MSEEFSWKSILATLIRKEHCSQQQTEWFMNELMGGNASPTAVGAVLTAQKMLGFSSEEVSAAASVMIAHAKPLAISGECADIVGTGGDGASTVNISTMAAIVVASCGVQVVKHGNRAASSKSGAADCLEALGLPLELSPENVAKLAEEVGITFAFARTFHPAMRFVAPVRGELGIPTIFNILGPLTNPARPAIMSVGVADRTLSPLVAQVLAERGNRGMVYTSRDGLDELVPTSAVSIWEFKRGEVVEYECDAVADLGLQHVSIEDLRGGEPEYNAQVVRDLLANKDIPCRETVLLNAASVLVAQGTHPDLADYAHAPITERFRQGIAIANHAIESGAAQQLLTRWINRATELYAAQIA